MKNLIFSVFFIFSASLAQAQSLSDAFESDAGFSDEQNKEAQNFVHEGKRQEHLKQGCEKLQGGCDINQVTAQGSVFKGDMLQALENNIGKLYTAIYGGMSLMNGKGPSVKVIGKPEKSEDGTVATNPPEPKLKGKEKKAAAEDKADYCAYAAMGYEVVGTFVQQGMQNKIEERLDKDPTLKNDMQRKSLLALKQTHEARRKTSNIQATIYSATSACYITRAIASKGRVVMDFGYWAKMSASAALGTLYYVKASKHAKAAKVVEGIINDLPGSGDCNPWTKTSCFCSEVTSKTAYPDLYQEICVLGKGNASVADSSLGCGQVQADGSIVNDPTCTCKKNNSCYKVSLNPNSVNFSGAKNFMSLANQGYDLLNGNEFKEGEFSSYAFNAAAGVKKTKEKIATNKVKQPALTKEQKAIADSLKGEMGEQVANLIARSSDSPVTKDLSQANLSPSALSVDPKIAEEVNSKAELKYTSGSGFESQNSSTEEINPFAALTQESTNESGTEVLSFAEKAMQNNADVNTAPDKPLFEIISNRYMRSGWKKVESSELK